MMEREAETEEQALQTENLKRILESDAPKKLIVAGPGTGKTYTFKVLLERAAQSRNLAVTFINNLASDLSRELGSMADARTFHSFSKWMLHRMPSTGLSHEFQIYPDLAQIITEDFEILGRRLAKWDTLFRARSNDRENIDPFLERSNFYDAVGFDDCVYRVVRAFSDNSNLIPIYDLVLVDEYQDFNALEVALIDHLASKSNIVVVGDDDQALYDQLRDASPEYIRELFHGTTFENFELPFCMRCPEVIVHSVESIIGAAKERGLLSGRIEKQYRYFAPAKSDDSRLHPRINLVKCSVHTKKAPYLAKYIEQQHAAIPEEDILGAKESGIPYALVIGPHHIIRAVRPYLESAGIPLGAKAKQPDPAALIAARLLMQDVDSNLGWRIIVGEKYRQYLTDLVKAAEDNPLSGFVPTAIREEVVHFTDNLVLYACGNDIGVIEETRLAEYFGVPLGDLRNPPIEDAIDEATVAEKSETPAYVKLTTFEGSKGLSAYHVFVLGFNESLLPKRNSAPTDREVRQLLVALTRTRKQCHLLSVGRFGGVPLANSVFERWLDPRDLNHVRINKDSFK